MQTLSTQKVLRTTVMSKALVENVEFSNGEKSSLENLFCGNHEKNRKTENPQK